MTLHRLLYRSELAIPGTSDTVRAAVEELIRRSSERNARDGVTGALMVTSGVCLQALEGPPAALEATFERICRDLRHRRVRLLEYTVAEERVFEAWAMVRVDPTRELARLCPGIDLVEDRAVDAATAGSTIELMRTVLMTKAVTHPVDLSRSA